MLRKSERRETNEWTLLGAFDICLKRGNSIMTRVVALGGEGGRGGGL